MPSSRRLKVTGLVALLTVCIIFYITNGASTTKNSEFYRRTVAAINDKKAAREQSEATLDARLRSERVEQVQKEHDAAIAAAETQGSGIVGGASEKQKPLVQNVKSAATLPTESITSKSIAGRKYMKDGKVVVYKSKDDNGHDGVAKVGNVGPQSSRAVAGTQKEDNSNQEVEAALNDILKKGPIIVFSKTFCPFSKKAKVSQLCTPHSTVMDDKLTHTQHILLDLYNISPPPYVVELDEHPLGSELQSALEKTTGRRTVPNVLINGRSIGGGDDVQELHDDDELIRTITSYGGKRIVNMEKVSGYERKTEMRFKA